MMQNHHFPVMLMQIIVRAEFDLDPNADSVIWTKEVQPKLGG